MDFHCLWQNILILYRVFKILMGPYLGKPEGSEEMRNAKICWVSGLGIRNARPEKENFGHLKDSMRASVAVIGVSNGEEAQTWRTL